MLNLSIMPLDTENIDEVCEDIIEQQRSGATTHALMIMYFTPEGTPPQKKAEFYCKKYDMYRERLDRAGAKHGVLVQSTMGHIVVPSTPHPFQTVVNLTNGTNRVTTCCPLDPGFREYIKGEMRTLAEHHPSIVMIDDDVGLLYRDVKGCACERHLAEISKRAGKKLDREALYAHTQGKSEEDIRITKLYTDLIGESLVGAVRAMREGLDEVDPTIQGVVSGIYTGSFCEFSGEVAEAFAGKGNPKIVRMNGGPYSNSTATGGLRQFTANMFRAAILKENVKDKVDRFLAETDTCPQNRYSTSASLLHAHFTAAILEGATGAKHWITRLSAHEPASGKAYRKKLSKHSKFYESLTKYAAELKPFGCRIPLTLMQNYGFVPAECGLNLSPWSSCVLERLGFPMYFGNDPGGAVFLDDFSVDGFSDDQIREFMRGALILSANAADKLNRRGFITHTGVEVYDWQGESVGAEFIYDKRTTSLWGNRAIRPVSDGVEALSHAVHKVSDGEFVPLYPAVTAFKNPDGGETFVFGGTPDTPFKYFSAFSLLNETRKRQFVDILSREGNLPVYYPEDAEVYLRAGYLPNGKMLVALFNLSLDELEDIPLTFEKVPKSVCLLSPDGDLIPISFTVEGSTLRIDYRVGVLEPIVLIIDF